MGRSFLTADIGRFRQWNLDGQKLHVPRQWLQEARTGEDPDPGVIALMVVRM